MIVFWITFSIVLLFGFVVFRGAPYVPSKKSDLRTAFNSLYPLTNKDHLIDIGSGDGIVLREAARHGARATGYELNPVLVLIARILSRGNIHITTELKDFWHAHFPDDTTVVYTFGDGRDIEKMASKVEHEATRIGRPLYFVSYGFVVRHRTAERSVGAHTLYRINPLQQKKP